METAHTLPADQFLDVVQHAPLACVHLLCRNRKGQALLGLRQNRPAQDMWAAPGGRIQKGERVADAVARLALKELGLRVATLPPPRLLGAFEHLHEDNVTGEGGWGTHEIVLAWQLDLEDHTPVHHDRQHRALRWFDLRELVTHPQVHAYTRAYFDASIQGTQLRGA